MNKINYKVSVLIPGYNGERYIGEAIESVLRQTYDNFELLIGDDCSTDNTLQIIQKYAKKDLRIRLIINNHNFGTCARHLNSLFLKATGEYIKILIQDDVLHADCLKDYGLVLESRPEVSLVTSYQQFIGDRNDIRKQPIIPFIGEVDGRQAQSHILVNGNWVGGETAPMFRRRDLYVGLFNPDWLWSADRDLWIRLLSVGNLYVIPKILTYPRVHKLQDTMTQNKNFRFEKEELLLLKVAFLFPILYGNYNSREQEEMYKKNLSRLIFNGLETRKISSIIEMIQLGASYGTQQFLESFIATIYYHLPRSLSRSRTAKILKEIYKLIVKPFREYNWRKKYLFVSGKTLVETDYSQIETFGRLKFPLRNLIAPIWTPTGKIYIPIEATPHYQWIKNLVKKTENQQSKITYQKYLENYYPEVNAVQGMEKIRALVLSYLKTKTPSLEIVITTPEKTDAKTYKATIYDGIHRAALALALGHKDISCFID